MTHEMDNENTICAVATGRGGAIGVVRVSGRDAVTITDRIFRPSGSNKATLAERDAYTVTYGHIYDDNGERAIFFARGVLETVKKLRWTPDIIHCQGWMCSIIPLYIKKAYQDEPSFANTKVVTSLFSEELHDDLGANFRQSIEFRDVKADILDKYNNSDVFGFQDLQKLAIDYSDGIVNAGKSVNPELIAYAKESGLPFMDNPADDEICPKYEEFYDKVFEGGSE